MNPLQLNKFVEQGSCSNAERITNLMYVSGTYVNFEFYYNLLHMIHLRCIRVTFNARYIE